MTRTNLLRIGTATQGFMARATEAGHRWIASYFQNHSETVRTNAERNSTAFLNRLAQEVERAETEPAAKARVQAAQDEPSFSAILEQATLGAAQTESDEKHRLLARLVTERLTTTSESLLSLASRIACEALPSVTSNQLKLLGFQANLFNIRPSLSPSPISSLQELTNEDIERTKAEWQTWLTNRFTPYVGLQLHTLDLLHLESLSLLRTQAFFARQLQALLAVPNRDDVAFDVGAFVQTPVGREIDRLLKAGVQESTLTTAGQLIGVYVADMLSGTRTQMSSWS